MAIRISNDSNKRISSIGISILNSYLEIILKFIINCSLRTIFLLNLMSNLLFVVAWNKNLIDRYNLKAKTTQLLGRSDLWIYNELLLAHNVFTELNVKLLVCCSLEQKFPNRSIKNLVQQSMWLGKVNFIDRLTYWLSERVFMVQFGNLCFKLQQIRSFTSDSLKTLCTRSNSLWM